MDIELKLSPELIQAGIEIIKSEIDYTSAHIGEDDFLDADLMSYYANRARLYRALRKAQDISLFGDDA